MPRLATYLPSTKKLVILPELLLFFTLTLLLAMQVQAQESGSKQIGGVITATNNGVSIIPSFTLGRPALLFDLSLSGERFSFDPMLRFGMDGKPWSFVFWGRYKAIKDKPFTLTVGAHPAFIFAERIVKVIMHGLRGPIKVKGVAYNYDMPAAGFLTDEQIAGVLTYIRREWDHEADPVSVDLVKKVRAEHKGRTDAWTEPEFSKK